MSLPSYLEDVYQVKTKTDYYEVIRDDREYYENLGKGTIILKIKSDRLKDVLAKNNGLDDLVELNSSYNGLYNVIITNTFNLNVATKSKTDTVLRIAQKGKNYGFQLGIEQYPEIKDISKLKYKVLDLTNPKVIFYYQPDNLIFFFHSAIFYDKKDIKKYILF